MRLRTNSKINLFLRVLAGRVDGYHEVETIYHSVGLSDDIEITSTESGLVEVEMVFADGLTGELPEPSANLVHRAAELLAASSKIEDGVRVKVTKRIPIAAGLGGGSGNAAGALVALAEHWKLDHTPDSLVELALQLGSDVPYCIKGGTVLASGRGEKLTPLTNAISAWYVLGISSRGLPTSEVYSAWDEIGSRSQEGPAAMTVALGAGDIEEAAALLHNDLEPAAFHLRPELAEKKEELLRAGALGAVISGSGPTLIGVVGTEADALALAAKVEGTFDRIEVADSRQACVEVAPATSGHRS